MSWFDRFYNQQVKTQETPTDILVGLLCQRIEAEALTTDAMLIRGYYDSHRWSWREKGIHIDFMTESYAANARVRFVERILHAGKEIELSDEQKVKLRISLNTSQQYALQQIENQKKADRELAACEAIASVLGLADPDTVYPSGAPIPPTHRKVTK